MTHPLLIAEPFLKEIEVELKSTRALLMSVPQEHFSWKPHEKSMSLYQLAYHVADLIGWIELIITTDLLDFNASNYKPLQFTTTEELVGYLDEKVNKATQALEGIDEATLFKTWKMCSGTTVYFELPKIAVIRTWALNHLYHHRGQLSVYLRLLDVPLPRIYGPNADTH